MESNKYLTQSFNEILFENRNKDYGSYILRKIISGNTRTGLLISIIAVTLFTSFIYIDFSFGKKDIAVIYIETEVDLSEPPPIFEALPPAVPPAIKKVETVALQEMEVKEDDEVKEIDKSITVEKSDTTINGTAENGSTHESEKTGDGNTVYSKVDKLPEYPGGKVGLYRYLKDNVEYPKVAKENNIAGTVDVYFVVNIDGTVSDVKIIKGIGGGCDQEAVRVVSEMRRWKPGLSGGMPVRVSQSIYITFNLTE